MISLRAFCLSYNHSAFEPRTSLYKDFGFNARIRGLTQKNSLFSVSHFTEKDISTNKNCVLNGKSIGRLSVNVSSLDISTEKLELLDAYEDEYDGIIINPDCLPSSPDAFIAALRSSLSNWKGKEKKGVWLKILKNQSGLVPIAIKEGFNYHHAEKGYVMLTYWIPEEPCVLPSTGSHQVGIGAFVINEKNEILVVKEKKCPLRCSGIWKLPTGFIDKSEEIFSGAVREVKEETGVDTEFVEIIAFRHAHFVAFEKSDLFFICLLRPLSTHISIDESEIQDAKWMPLDEFSDQPFYRGDYMSRKVIDLCISNHGKHSGGFIARQLISKLDGKLSYFYYNDVKM